jgi:hypothetical protein
MSTTKPELTRSQAVRAAKTIERQYPHLCAEAYESALHGGWAVEVTQRNPWKALLWSQDEVRDLLSGPTDEQDTRASRSKTSR